MDIFEVQAGVHCCWRRGRWRREGRRRKRGEGGGGGGGRGGGGGGESGRSGEKLHFSKERLMRKY